MEPIRILQVVTVMNRGGIETMLMNYYRQIDRSKIQFDFLVHRTEPGRYDEEIIKLGGRIFYMPSIRPGNYRKYFRLLDQFFSTHREYKVVHSHINENSSYVLRAAKKAGIPGRIVHSHTSESGMDIKILFRLYARYTMKNNPSDYFACSKNAGEWLFGKKFSESNEIIVLKNAVNANKFTFNKDIRKKTRNILGISNKLVIGHIGTFYKPKNHDFLINIFYELQKKEPNAILLLVGEGKLKLSIEKKVNQLGLTKKVLFLGVREDVSDLMQAIDLFLFPSIVEGLPVVLIEAQAAGVKCLVSNSVTQESDITGLVEFMSLKISPEKWAEKILSVSYEHTDTFEIIAKHGFNSTDNAKWLADFYIQFHPENHTLVGGF